MNIFKQLQSGTMTVGCIALLTLHGASALNTEATGFQVNNGETKNITAHGICKSVANTSGSAHFVATKSSTEWTSFIDNTPSGITLGSCGCQPGVDIHLGNGQVWDGCNVGETTTIPYGNMYDTGVNDPNVQKGNPNFDAWDEYDQGPCPAGYMVPSAHDWQDAADFLGMDNVKTALNLSIGPIRDQPPQPNGTLLTPPETLAKYQSTSPDPAYPVSQGLYFIFGANGSYPAEISQGWRLYGSQVRCIKRYTSRPCPIANGTGTQTFNWTTQDWGTCEVVTCNSGYHATPDNTACISDTPTYCLNGAGSTASWIGGVSYNAYGFYDASFNNVYTGNFATQYFTIDVDSTGYASPFGVTNIYGEWTELEYLGDCLYASTHFSGDLSPGHSGGFTYTVRECRDTDIPPSWGPRQRLEENIRYDNEGSDVLQRTFYSPYDDPSVTEQCETRVDGYEYCNWSNIGSYFSNSCFGTGLATQSCTMTNGTGVRVSDGGGGWGPCQVLHCNTGYKTTSDGSACIPG